MSGLVVVAALGWAIYHAGIEQGRKRASRQGEPRSSVVSTIRQRWPR